MSDSPFDKLFGGGADADGFFFGLPEERPGRAERRAPEAETGSAPLAPGSSRERGGLVDPDADADGEPPSAGSLGAGPASHSDRSSREDGWEAPSASDSSDSGEARSDASDADGAGASDSGALAEAVVALMGEDSPRMRLKTNDGRIRTTLFVPRDVLDTVGELADAAHVSKNTMWALVFDDLRPRLDAARERLGD